MRRVSYIARMKRQENSILRQFLSVKGNSRLSRLMTATNRTASTPNSPGSIFQNAKLQQNYNNSNNNNNPRNLNPKRHATPNVR